MLLAGVAGAGRVVVGPEEELDAVAADGQGLDHRVAAGLGGEGGELASEEEGGGQQGDEEGADSVPVAHDASLVGAEGISHGLRRARSTRFGRRCQ
jgi:hypothetical protein